MISARQSAANHSSQLQLEERTTTLSPRSLREIRLSYVGKEVSGKQPPDIEFMRAVQNAAVDADVYWSGVKWEE
ncbi:hypothetical protein M407DRAFT_240392 [Tulasnella calospora MUT 4182]|uniref:Uncharacterized protein n=1 Tax=Tulasnella calospora MUT 4182 TaxID=1051891 RepID=A0A0C3Q4G9_9AGAM|nr:hypothetical protein M407DRAFT_246550 [Tulasnella calospora MUT 4182]KIO34460.1 hypothetical protein M407DRAFT_240392 [Tulasnella calospora MUT 4182]